MLAMGLFVTRVSRSILVNDLLANDIPFLNFKSVNYFLGHLVGIDKFTCCIPFLVPSSVTLNHATLSMEYCNLNVFVYFKRGSPPTA